MPKLSPAELRIVRSMLSQEFGLGSSLLEQAADLEVEPRHMTGTGYYAHFQQDEASARAPIANTELSEDYRTRREAPCDAVGFTLFIRNGCLNSFEGYTFGDVAWPEEPMEEWLIFDPVGAPRQKAK
jgi:hypothetical protein